jgi:hypothetical protein
MHPTSYAAGSDDPTVEFAPIPVAAPRGERVPRLLRRLATGLAVVGALMLGVFSYLALAAVGAMAAFVLAILALWRSRPRRKAGLALAVSILLPAITTTAGVLLGIDVAKQNLAADMRAGISAANYAVDAADAWDLDVPEPVRDLLRNVADQPSDE